MKYFTLFKDIDDHLTFELLKRIDNYEYVPGEFTQKYDLAVKLKTQFYELNYRLDFLGYNLVSFRNSLNDLYHTMNGKAFLNNGFYDNDLTINIHNIGSLGKIELNLEILRYGINEGFVGKDRFLFIRGMDQSYLPELIHELDEFLN